MKKLVAFTLAEVLITLAIIGVVAALTIPTLVTSYQKKMYVTQLKKSYNNLSNGFKTIMAQDGVTKLSDTTLWSKIPADDSGSGYVWSGNINDPEYKPFFDEFKKIFKISAEYGEENFPEKFSPKYKFLNGEGGTDDDKIFDSGIFFPDGSFIFFEFDRLSYTVRCNGSSDCTSLSQFQETHNTKTKFWNSAGTIYVDINGPKGPNIFGRDLFVFYLGNDGMLYPIGGADVAIYEDSSCEYDNLESCKYYWKNESGDYACNLNSDGFGCAGRIMEEGWKMTY